MSLWRPERIIADGACTPSAWYSETTARAGLAAAPPSIAPARLTPSPSPAIASVSRPASSSTVGAKSTSETGPATRAPRAAAPGARTISGTRADCSRKLILYQRPLSPSISPWSAQNRTVVRSSRPASRSARSTWPMRSSR